MTECAKVWAAQLYLFKLCLVLGYKNQAPTRQLITLYNSCSRGSIALFWPLPALDIHMVHKYTFRQTLVYIKLENKNSNIFCFVLQKLHVLKYVLNHIVVNT